MKGAERTMVVLHPPPGTWCRELAKERENEPSTRKQTCKDRDDPADGDAEGRRSTVVEVMRHGRSERFGRCQRSVHTQHHFPPTHTYRTKFVQSSANQLFASVYLPNCHNLSLGLSMHSAGEGLRVMSYAARRP